MVHVISVLLKINKSTRENADFVCGGGWGERVSQGWGESVLIWGESMI